VPRLGKTSGERIKRTEHREKRPSRGEFFPQHSCPNKKIASGETTLFAKDLFSATVTLLKVLTKVAEKKNYALENKNPVKITLDFFFFCFGETQ
jgi:hypothetical protein